MILLGLAALVVCASADGPVNVCDDCEFSIGGIGYLAGPNCRQFYQCRKLPSGWIDEVLLCCPKGTRWNQEIKNCDWGHDCDAGFDGCPDEKHEEGSCNLWADEDNQAWYFVHPMWAHQMCPAGTVYRQEVCGCVHGYGYMCYQDPLLHFPFAYDFNDIQCPKAAGMGHGDAYIDEVGGYMRLDGDGDYMTFAFLNNWFANNAPEHFTLTMWFKQTDAGFGNIFNTPEGLFSNGNCHQPQTIWLELENSTANGGIKANAEGEFSGFSADRDYSPPNVWCQIAIRYSQEDEKVTFFLNGIPVDMTSASGEIMGTMSDSSVGLAFLQCIPSFFTGCIDDVMVFVRYVSDWEMLSCVYGNGRTLGGSEKMYTCPEHQPMQNPFD